MTAALSTFAGAAPDVPALIGLVVEDDPQTRDWLTGCLRAAFGDVPVSTAENVAGARAWLADRNAAGDDGRMLIALIDLGLPDGSGVDVVRLLAGKENAVPVVTTIYDDDGHLFDAVAAGAAGYLLKDRSAPMMVDYLRRIQSGEPPMSPSLSRRILEYFRTAAAPAPPEQAPEPTQEPVAALTPRERDVLALLGRGLRTSEAAGVLKLSEHTVAGHIKAIYAKLNISSRAEAALEARNRGLA